MKVNIRIFVVAVAALLGVAVAHAQVAAAVASGQNIAGQGTGQVSSRGMGISIPIGESDAELGRGQILATFELADPGGKGSMHSGASPDSGMPFPLPAGSVTEALWVRVQIQAEKLNVDRNGRPADTRVRWSFGGRYQDAKWDDAEGWIFSIPMAGLSASMRTLTLLVDYSAGRSHTYVLGKAISALPLIGNWFTKAKNTTGRVNSGYVFPIIDGENFQNAEEVVAWQWKTASMIMQGAIGAIGGIVPGRMSDKLSQLRDSYLRPAAPQVQNGTLTLKGDADVKQTTEPKVETKPEPKLEPKPEVKVEVPKAPYLLSWTGKGIRVKTQSTLTVTIVYGTGKPIQRTLDGTAPSLVFEWSKSVSLTLEWEEGGKTKTKTWSADALKELE